MPQNRKLYAELSSCVIARLNCIESGNTIWESNHTERAESLVREHMPSGSGIDSGMLLDLDKSTGERLVFNFSFHHMNDTGMYDGWTEHSLIVTPSLTRGFDMRITGRDRRSIKEYLYDVFGHCLDITLEDQNATN
jgi:hypothetical protein